MILEPGADAILMVKMLARKLVDLVVTLELFEAYLTVFGLNDVRAFDDPEVCQEGLGGWIALRLKLVHGSLKNVLDVWVDTEASDLTQRLIKDLVDEIGIGSSLVYLDIDAVLATGIKV